MHELFSVTPIFGDLFENVYLSFYVIMVHVK